MFPDIRLFFSSRFKKEMLIRIKPYFWSMHTRFMIAKQLGSRRIATIFTCHEAVRLFRFLL